MSYKKYRSPALRKFWVDLQEVGVLMTLIRKNAMEARFRVIQIMESLCRSVVLLLCSHMENFFESMVIDVLNFHETNQTPISELPQELKVTQVFQGKFDHLSAEEKWKMFTQLVSSQFASNDGRCTKGLFDPELHIKSFASPGTKEINKLFKSIGISGIWQISSVEPLQRSLNAFLPRRNQITHGGSSDRPTPADVKGFIQDVCRIVVAFNAVVSEYLIKEFKVSDPWSIALQFS
jgi:RiboL-PSP-HEPN